MTQKNSKIGEVLDRAREIPPGRGRLAFLDAAIRKADSVGDVKSAYEMRMALIDTAFFNGHDEWAIVAFSWCLARFDESPDEYSLFDILQKYKGILSYLPNVPAISRVQIIAMEDDMERRYRTCGIGLRSVYYMRWCNLMRMGDLYAAVRFYEAWQDTNLNDMSECGACAQSNRVELMSRLNLDKEALAFAGPILEGTLSCSSVPKSTYGIAIRTLLRLGRSADAQKYHEVGYSKISGNEDYLGNIAEHLLYLVVSRDLSKAVRIFERHLLWCVETANLSAKYSFFAASTALLEVLRISRSGTMKLNLPKALASWSDTGKYELHELTAWWRRETTTLADQFDVRNGNDYFTNDFAEVVSFGENGPTKQIS